MVWNPSPEVGWARDFGLEFGKDVVVVLAIDAKADSLEAISYGKTRAGCTIAKKLADAGYDAVMKALKEL